MTDKPEPVTVYYDGSCPLCRSEIGLYQRGEGAGQVTWCDISQPGAAPQELTQEAAMARFHVKGADGQMEDGARAFILLWLSLPRWRWLGRIASLPPLPILLEGLYRAFLPLRPWLQRLARRRVPAPFGPS
jgi:predicted DCC family thiol-disulfide oxidoreductase YuxK